MKNNSNKIISYFPARTFVGICLLSSLLLSCGNPQERSAKELINEGNLEQLKQRRTQLGAQQQEIQRELEQINRAIDQLDPARARALVQIQRIEDTVFKHFTQVQGDVATDQNILIYPETAGVLLEVRVKEGQQVRQGQVLARVEDGGLANELSRLQTQAELARTTFERQERLWNQNIGSEIQYLEAKSNYEAAQQMVAQVQTQLNRSIIKAPFSGTIDQVFVEQGEVVSPGQNQLFRLVNLENMYVEANIPEIYLGAVQKGTEVLVRISSIGRDFSGRVDRVGNTIHPGNRTFRAEISIPNEDGLVKPNQIAMLRFNDYTNPQTIVIPEVTIQQDAEGNTLVYVWETVDENSGIARRTFVETGRIYNGQVEIVEGLEPGQLIITEGSRNLRDGQEVELAAGQEQ